MQYRDAQQALRALYAVATTQGGYFTAKQAGDAGYGNRHLNYHAEAGNFERVGHSLYRLPTVPLDEHDELIRLTLWSRDRRDHPQAVVSYATALAFHQLSDVLPVQVHLTVPPSFRKPLPAFAPVVLHKAVLAASDVQEAASFRVTTPARTILDVAADPSFSREQLDKTIADALKRGLVQRSWLRRVSRHLELV